MRTHSSPKQRPQGRSGVLRGLTTRAFGWMALATWLLGGLLLPLLHQVNHDHAHSHGTSYRLLRTSHHGVQRIAIGSHEHAAHHHGAHPGLLSKAWRWLAHLWSHAHHHGHHHTHHAHGSHTHHTHPDAGQTPPSRASGLPQHSHHADPAEAPDPSHGEGSLAHFDLLDKTSVPLVFGLPHRPISGLKEPSIEDQRPRLRSPSPHRPRAPPV